jgi:hypothetical protein
MTHIKKSAISLAMGAALLSVPLSSFAQTSDPSYHCKSSSTCIGADHVVFNRYSNYPLAGNERHFYDAKDDANTARGGFYDVLPVKDGETVAFRIYVHNNADPAHNKKLTSNAAVAKNVKVLASLPTGEVTNYQSKALITADNAAPRTVNDTVMLKSTQPFTVEYLGDSAQFYGVNQPARKLSDEIAGTGVMLGNIRPGGQNIGYVVYKVRIHTVKPAASAPAATAKPTPTQQPVAAQPAPVVAAHPVTSQTGSSTAATQAKPTTPAVAQNTVTNQVVTQSQPLAQPTMVAAAAQPAPLPATGPVSAGAGALGATAIGYAMLAYRRSRLRLAEAMGGRSLS